MTVQERGLGGQAVTDDEVLRFTTSEGRSVVTLNRRHCVRLDEHNAKHAGIVARTVDTDFCALAGRIDAAIHEHDELTGRLVRVNCQG